jgi:hypothetical protein
MSYKPYYNHSHHKSYYDYNNHHYKGDSFWKQNSLYIMIGGLIFILFMLWVAKKLFDKYFKPNAFSEHYFNKATYASKRKGYGQGRESKGESFAREIAPKIFGKPFDKIRPDFLKNNVTGHNLELDLYSPELKLGIEISGKQHYVYTPFFHKNEEAFTNQKYRDEIKRMLCKQNGIKLIEVPYNVKNEDMETFIRIEGRKLGFEV